MAAPDRAPGDADARVGEGDPDDAERRADLNRLISEALTSRPGRNVLVWVSTGLDLRVVGGGAGGAIDPVPAFGGMIRAGARSAVVVTDPDAGQSRISRVDLPVAESVPAQR